MGVFWGKSEQGGRLRGHEHINLVVVGKVFAEFGTLGFAFLGEERVVDGFAVPGGVVEAFGVTHEVECWWHC